MSDTEATPVPVNRLNDQVTVLLLNIGVLTAKTTDPALVPLLDNANEAARTVLALGRKIGDRLALQQNYDEAAV